MILFDRDILKAMEDGDITIHPFIDSHLGTNSYDVRLANRLLVYTEPEQTDNAVRYLDLRAANPTRELTIPEDGLVLKPGIVYLGVTMERVETHAKYVPHLEGRSSVGRLGLSIHITAGFGDCGFTGRWTLELTVVHPLKVYAGERVAQAYFIEGKTTPINLYKGKYRNFEEPVPSRMHEDAR